MTHSRRTPLIVLAALVVAALLSPAHAADQPNVIVLGIDGMDPNLLQKYVSEGKMPTFERLMSNGYFSPLETSMPPQSPVAWSNFITGMDSGGHGIFDFIHQDRSNYMPTFSAALVEAPERTLRLGKFVIPLSKGRVELLRQGTAFWQLLDTRDVPYLVFRIPANFPPTESSSVSVAGMGTPDLLGTYGTFSFYTDDPTLASVDVSGGRVYPITVEGARVETVFHGPENSLLVDSPELTTPFVVHIDTANKGVLIDIGHDRILLQEGEWSDWFEIRFNVLGPLQSVSGITRLYLKSIEPHFQLYATPVNINPRKPALPLSSEPAFYKKLSEKIGYFYTQGMPEDTKALEWGMFTDGEFVQQTQFVFEERLRMLDAVLDDYDGGFLFFYFSSIDQVCHMLWRNMDPNHPGHNPETAHYGEHVEHLYVSMDSVLAVVQSRVASDAKIIVMSDHGFAPYYWKVNLNTWLYEKGYMSLKRPESIGQQPLYHNVFWRRTRAFALGINGIYVNLRGREAQGVVKPGEEYEELLDEITADLLDYRDPNNGRQVVKEVYRGSEIYHGELAKDGPDLIIGYDGGYRASDRTAIGQLADDVITPNMDKWSGDHCMALDVVPGILVTNLPIAFNDPTLLDLSATILALYGIAPSPTMRGRVLLDTGAAGSP